MLKVTSQAQSTLLLLTFQILMQTRSQQVLFRLRDLPTMQSRQLSWPTLQSLSLGVLAQPITSLSSPLVDFKGQFFFDEKNEDLYIFTGESFLPITVISGNLVNAGTYNANTNLLSSVTTAGSAAGFTNGSALPAPATGNLNYYVVVDTSGTGSGNAPAVALAPPDMLISLGTGSTFQLIDVSNAIAGQTASNISVVAAGNISSTDVQAALQELDTEKLGAASPTLTGTVLLGQNATLSFEGSSDNDFETTLTVTDPTADRTITFPNVTGNVVTTGDSGTVTSTMIANGTIANADISSSAEIAVSKLTVNGAARQLLQTASTALTLSSLAMWTFLERWTLPALQRLIAPPRLLVTPLSTAASSLRVLLLMRMKTT